ncbi:ATP-dependent RNA helicase suv3 mitochondrial [Phtheirospermum japonicum]|uniref:ATP-dependent RNA helicase suv3 mitochondrial n=1 Tax=Phtheirospermum japonicum TaxID=374723 RepID=A0A830BWP6_9LAMI|nr:ATP-dependent RNA helicase suv3 mitochondrial [Phtheirospermum japonicum]
MASINVYGSSAAQAKPKSLILQTSRVRIYGILSLDERKGMSMKVDLIATGIYCGPLRLLAWEVAQRLNKAKVPCDLITGQEREEVDGAKHKAVTVEMADVASDYKCAVVDEIQMLGCRTRGFSFTRALLGISADELHLCGDPAAVPLIQELLKVTDDNVEVQYYERLSPLVPSNVPLGSFSNIRTGDCIVTFSRLKIYNIKKQIENGRNHLCSVVYGSLPPETRTRQATMFNDETSDFDVLVASDAIGMGLNLNISRIIFSTLRKFDGVEMRELTVSEIKQIAVMIGLLWDEHFVDNAKLSENYFIADCEQLLKVAAVIDELPLTLNDNPVDMDDDISSQGLTQFAQSYCKSRGVRLKEIFTPGTLKVPKSHNSLKELESIHKVLDLYVWLSFHMEDSFPDRELAAAQKAICSMLIEEFLGRDRWQKPKVKLNRSPLKSLSG